MVNNGKREMFLGAKVTLDSKSRYWRFDNLDNPRSIVGKVVDSISECIFLVEWSNGRKNGYRQGDLKVLGEVVNDR